MKWILFLFIIIVIKTLLNKGLMLGLILLSIWLKGTAIRFSTLEWDKYFLSMKEEFLNIYFIVTYCISTVLSSCVTYMLFNVFGFQNSLFKTIILAMVCIIFSGIKYRKERNRIIKHTINRIQKSILEQGAKNI